MIPLRSPKNVRKNEKGHHRCWVMALVGDWLSAVEDYITRTPLRSKPASGMRDESTMWVMQNIRVIREAHEGGFCQIGP